MDVVSEYMFTKLAQIDGGEGQNSLGVFRSLDPQLSGEVAVKIIRKTDFPDPAAYFNEAQAMFRSDHPNVVPIRVATQTADEICLSMPFYPRGSLARRIAQGPISLCDVLRVGQQILAGVGAIHAVKTIHFDIKPSNVLFSDHDTAMIADFGQARTIGQHGVTLMPNRMYALSIPPETFTNGRRGTVESDIFQVGMTMYRAVNGEPSFSRELPASDDLQQQITKGKFPRRQYLPHVPSGLRRAINKALNVDPAKRYPSAAAFSNALASIPIVNNWETQHHVTGGTTWTANRQQQPSLRVALQERAGRWGIEIHTVQHNAARKSRKAFWRSGMSLREADAYLTQLFAALE